MKNSIMQLRAVHSIISFFEFNSQLEFSLRHFEKNFLQEWTAKL